MRNRGHRIVAIRARGLDDSFMRGRHSLRINLVPERPVERFSHGQDPSRTWVVAYHCEARLADWEERPFDRLQHDAAKWKDFDPSRPSIQYYRSRGELLLMAAGISNARRLALLDTDLLRYQLA
jgi:hypothetical protein